MQDVAISVTAFSGEQMAELGVTNAIDLIAQVPGLKVSRAGAGAINNFSIRGVTQNDFAASQESPVAVYVDEAYISLNTHHELQPVRPRARRGAAGPARHAVRP